jgi:hypothetical protein
MDRYTHAEMIHLRTLARLQAGVPMEIQQPPPPKPMSREEQAEKSRREITRMLSQAFGVGPNKPKKRK